MAGPNILFDYRSVSLEEAILVFQPCQTGSMLGTIAFDQIFRFWPLIQLMSRYRT